LVKYCKKLQFQVVIQTSLGPLQRSSIIFGSHNNGKANKSPENVPSPSGLFADKKRKIGSGDEVQDVNLIDGNLEVHGFVKARAFMQFSDIRLKTDIADLTDALNIISNLQGKTYCWKNDGTVLATKGGQRVIGLIAQEVQRVLPEIVTEDPETGLLSVSYAELVPVLIEAFKEHLKDYANDKEKVHNQLEELQAKVTAIESANKTYRPRMSQYVLYPQPLQYNPQYPQPFIQPQGPSIQYPTRPVVLQQYPPSYTNAPQYPMQAAPQQQYPPNYNQAAQQTTIIVEEGTDERKSDIEGKGWRVLSILLIVFGGIAIGIALIVLGVAKRRDPAAEGGLWFVGIIIGVFLCCVGSCACLICRPKAYKFISGSRE